MKTANIKAQIADEVRAIAPFDDLEQAHIIDTLVWLESGANIFRVAKPDKPPKHLVSYFVVVDTAHRSLLLGDHTKAHLWLPSGGHVELNEHPRQTVIREAEEEVNVHAVFLNHERPLFLTSTSVTDFGITHTDVTFWYVISGDMHEPLKFDRREFDDMNWFGFDEILESHPAIFDPHMQRFTAKLKLFLQSRTI